MLHASVLSAITDALTEIVGDHGIYAVFILMFVDAVLPAASELVMVYAGALAAGAFAGQNVVLFGEPIESEPWAVAIGRVTPVVRSFIAIPAGVFRMPLGRYTLLTIPGSVIWAFAFAGAGWAAGSQWEDFHHSFRYAEYVVAAAILLLIVAGIWRHRRGARIDRRAEDPAG